VDPPLNALYAFAEHDAIGFSPFAIESIPDRGAEILSAGYDLIAQLSPLLAEHQGRGTMAGLLQEHPDSRAPQELRLGGYVLHASFEHGARPSLADGGGPTAAPAFPAGGLVIATAPDELLFAGIGVTVTFATLDDGPTPNVGLQSVEEGRFQDGKWQHLRWLNGDQTHQGRHIRLEPGRFTIQKVRLYRY
jgi:hypothetical protein